MKSISVDIFNVDKEDYERTPLFLGERGGLIDTVNKQYPVIWKIYKKQKSLDWDENEFDFISCNKEFKTCSPSIYDMMIKTLAWQWEADSVASRHLSPIVAPFISSSELWAAWQRVGDNECLTGDHEVLTPQGWKRIDQITDKDMVAQWNYHDRSISFVFPDRIIVKHYTGPMYHFYCSNNNISQITTPKHRMPVIYPYWINNNQPHFKTAEKVHYHGGNGLPTAGYIANCGRHMTPQERLYVAVQADGSLCSNKYNGNYTGQMHYRFSFSKQRKIDRLLYLCSLANWKVSEASSIRNDGLRLFYVYVPISEYNPMAKSFDWFDLNQISYEWAIDFIDELKHWDGNISCNEKVRYISTNKACIDKVAALGHLTGQRAHVTIIPPRYNVLMPGGSISNTEECYQVHFTDKEYITGNSIIKSLIEYSGDVYCVTVPTGYFLIRHNNAVSVTGNCIHALTYSEIVRNSFDDPDEILHEVLQVKESLSRLSSIANALDKAYVISHRYALGQVEESHAYDAIFMFTVAMLILERIQFMSSFAVTFAIAETGMFMQIGKAVQKICQDEFEIHVELDKAILSIELETERGQDAYRRLRPQIQQLMEEVYVSEASWVNYAFSEGRELVGLNADLLMEWVKFNTTDVIDFLKLDYPFEPVRTNPIGFIENWISISRIQPSPQEEKNGQYMIGMVVDNLGETKLEVDF